MKYLITIISLIALVSCKDQKQEAVNNAAEEIETSAEPTNEQEAPSTAFDNSWANEIQLNGVQKWDANAATNEGVSKMKNRIDSQSSITLEAFHDVAQQLNEDKNYVVKNCTMKGASHDNLHIWLMPLIEKIDALSMAQSIEEASMIKQSIVDHLNAYTTYFK
jgi:hypothetical protein